MKRAVTIGFVGAFGLFACAQGVSRDGYLSEDRDPTSAADAGPDQTSKTIPSTASTGSIVHENVTDRDASAPEPRESDEVHEVFGHGAEVLYRLDPVTKAVTVVGSFDGCSGVSDIALDEHSTLYGVSKDALYEIDKTTASCKKLFTGTYPNSLSFVPKGTVDANHEALVGYDDADYIRIDLTTGKRSVIGKLGGPSGVISSGDVVSVKGGKTYLTVKGGSACKSKDCLYEVDPATGKKLHDWGSIEHKQVFGLAFWGGKLYGFAADGSVFEVTFGTSKIVTTELAVPNAPDDLSFWGAGSSTSVPVAELPK